MQNSLQHYFYHKFSFPYRQIVKQIPVGQELGILFFLEDFVVAFIQFIIVDMGITLCNLNTSMSCQQLCQLEVFRRGRRIVVTK